MYFSLIRNKITIHSEQYMFVKLLIQYLSAYHKIRVIYTTRYMKPEFGKPFVFYWSLENFDFDDPTLSLYIL